MHSTKSKWFGAVMASMMAVTLVSVTPAVAQDEACRGGGPAYWLKNPWPTPFSVPKKYQQPKTTRTLVRPETQFDAVFRWRKGRDQEGKIFPGKTLRQVLRLNGNPKKALARQAIAALLNAGEPSSQFSRTKQDVIFDFQVYWDGTDDLSKNEAQKHLKEAFVFENSLACPVAPAGQAD